MTDIPQAIVGNFEGDLPCALTRLSVLAQELGADHAAVEAADLAQRVAEGRFYVVCVGQFKRGKSTLLNALLGQSVLPTGLTPVTAVPTVVRYGEGLTARFRSRDGAWHTIAVADLVQYVSESLNPGNRKAVDGVEVFVPSPLLAGGMCLVDTPGLGSVFTANTEATHAFVPHVDAAIVVIGADPPLSGEEAGLVEAVSQHVRDLLIVINKADRVSEAELAASANFARENLEARLHRPLGPIFHLSASERLAGHSPERDWASFAASLQALAENCGAALVRNAGQRGVQRLAEQLLAAVQEERDALLRPIEESERRVAAMGQTIAEAERAMHELGFHFTAEQHRLSDLFLDRRKQFLATAVPAARADFNRLPHPSLAPVSRERVGILNRPFFRRAVMAQAQEMARRHILPWLSAE